ncbi:MAG: AmmeMemoRadiSam system protein A [Dehalococcoidia bacterium]|jgi:AmmeMemoRadiSam system protein A
MTEGMHPIVQLARQAVESYVKDGEVIRPRKLSSEMKEKAGVFVSLHKHGQLRGCIGTFEPTESNVAEEIVRNAIASAAGDPRFNPVRPSELPDLDYSVDILTSPEPAEDISKLDPKTHGVIVQCGYRRGLLLPDLEGVKDVETQISICRQKAGIGSNEPIKLFSFQVRRYR